MNFRLMPSSISLIDTAFRRDHATSRRYRQQNLLQDKAEHHPSLNKKLNFPADIQPQSIPDGLGNGDLTLAG
jgi:hypothetical protein